MSHYKSDLEEIRDHMNAIATLPVIKGAEARRVLRNIKTLAKENDLLHLQWKLRAIKPVLCDYDKITRTNEATIKDLRDKIIEGNQRLVVRLVLKYANKGVDLGDLLQEANLGLIKAVEKFNPWYYSDRTNSSVQFSTYATYAIKTFIKNCLNDQHLILKRNTNQKIATVVKSLESLRVSGNHNPTVYDVVDELNERGPNYQRGTWREEYVSKIIMGIKHQTPVPVHKTDQDAGDRDFSSASARGDTNMITIDPNPFEHEEHDIKMKMVNEALGSLDPRRIMAFKLRHGLHKLSDQMRLPFDADHPDVTDKAFGIREIGDHMGVSKERARQLSTEALTYVREEVLSS